MKLAIICNAFVHDCMYFECIPSPPPHCSLPSKQSDRTSVSCEPWVSSPCLTRCSRAVLISSHFVGVQNSTVMHPLCVNEQIWFLPPVSIGKHLDSDCVRNSGWNYSPPLTGDLHLTISLLPMGSVTLSLWEQLEGLWWELFLKSEKIPQGLSQLRLGEYAAGSLASQTGKRGHLSRVILIIRFRCANKRSRRHPSFHLKNDHGFMVYRVTQLLLSATVTVRGMKTERVFGWTKALLYSNFTKHHVPTDLKLDKNLNTNTVCRIQCCR